MHKSVLAALTAAVLLQPSLSFADGATSHSYVSRRAVNFQTDMAAVLVMASTGTPIGRSPVRSRAQMGTVREVILDGVKLRMDEVDIRDRIGLGAYAVVYPGTDAQWPPAATAPANYPPAWY